MSIRSRMRAVKAWLTEENVTAGFFGGGAPSTVLRDGVPRWKRLLRLPGKWIWRERDWLIKAVIAAAIGGAGVLVGKYSPSAPTRR